MVTKVPPKYAPERKNVELPEGLQKVVNDIHEMVSQEIQALEARIDTKLAKMHEYVRAQMADPEFEKKQLRIQLEDSEKAQQEGGDGR